MHCCVTQDSDEDDVEEAEDVEFEENEAEVGEDDSASDSQGSDEDDFDEADDRVLGNISKWKEPLKEKGRKKNPNLMQLVYGASGSSATALIDENHESSDDEEGDGEDFFKPKGEQSKVCHFKTIQSLAILSCSYKGIISNFRVLFFIYFQNLGGGSDVGYANSEDCSKYVNCGKLKDWKEKEVCESIRNRFTTGDWSVADLRNQNLGPGAKGENDELYGDFEDLETGEKHNSHENMELDANENEDVEVVERRLKKLALRAKFDKEYPFITE